MTVYICRRFTPTTASLVHLSFGTPYNQDAFDLLGTGHVGHLVVVVSSGLKPMKNLSERSDDHVLLTAVPASTPHSASRQRLANDAVEIKKNYRTASFLPFGPGAATVLLIPTLSQSFI